MDSGDLKLAPGFRFHPTDEELVMHYLCRRCAGKPIPASIIAEVDLYKYDPWLLPGLAIYGEKEWYFFSPRDRKYPNGSRPNRAAGSGYWKATGADKPVGLPKPVAIKKALVFYAGKAPKGVKTNWIMHEYRLAGVDRSARRKHSLRLDDWVLCRIHNKKGGAGRQGSGDRKPAGSRSIRPPPADIMPEPMKLESYPDVAPTGSQVPDPASLADLFCFGESESLPRLHADSSCSEHVLSPEFTCDREVESQLKWGELERALEIPATNMDAAPVFPPLDSGGQLSPLFGDPLQDVFMYLQKPF